MILAFDPAAERTRFEARQAFLARHWALALDLAPGIRFQPETEASVEDQVRETFWSEGQDPDGVPEGERREMAASFEVLSPRRESGGWSVAATLMFGFPDAIRAERLEALQGFPEALGLMLDDGRLVRPEVDRGFTAGEGRLPAVLALRYRIPFGRHPVALEIHHSALSGIFPGTRGWNTWLPA